MRPILMLFGLFVIGGALGAPLALIEIGSEAVRMPWWAWGIWGGGTSIMFGCALVTGRWWVVGSSFLAGMGVLVAADFVSTSEMGRPFLFQLVRINSWLGLVGLPLAGALVSFAWGPTPGGGPDA